MQVRDTNRYTLGRDRRAPMDQDIPTARVISDQSRLLTDSTDPWTYGTGYSVKPVARAIKTKHAGFNPCVLGSVITGTAVSRNCN